MKGYYKQEDLTSSVILEHTTLGRLYKTGDICKWSSQGYLEYIGRLDFQVKIRGQRVEIDEIQHVISSHSMVKDCAVLIQKDNISSDSIIYSFVILNDTSQNSLNVPEELLKWCKTHLLSFMIPQYYIQVDNWPLTPNGKIDRKNLLLLTESLYSSQIYYTAQDEIEQIIIDHLYQLNIFIFSPEINTWGLTSLNLIRLFHFINNHYNTFISLENLVECVYIKDISTLIKSFLSL